MTPRLVHASGLSSRTLLAIDVAGGVLLSIGAVVTVMSLSMSAPVAAAAIAVVGNSTVAWRRLAPYRATLVALVALVVYQHLSREAALDLQPFALILDLYLAASVETLHRHRTRFVALVVASLGGVVAIAANDPHFTVGIVIILALPAVIAPAVGGVMVARRRSISRGLARTRALLVDEQELAVELAASAERHRLARELHDVVAHGVSVMVIQAGVARLTAHDEAAAARRALHTVIAAGQEAVADLARVARSDGPCFDSARPGGLSRLSRLVDEVSALGLSTDLDVDGDWAAVGDDLGQVVYRVVQEALTNGLKHAGRGCAHVAIQISREQVHVRVVTTRRDTEAPPAGLQGASHGLVGMAERVAQHGGSLRAGPVLHGGYEVDASLPIAADTEPPAAPWRVVTAARSLWAAGSRWRPAVVVAVLLVTFSVEATLSAARAGPLAVNLAVVAAIAVSVLWRRSHPLFFCVAVNVLAIPLSGGLLAWNGAALVGSFVFVVPVYSVGAWAPRRAAVIGLAVTLAALVTVMPANHAPGSAIVDDVGFTVALWSLGRLVRAQRCLAADLDHASQDLLTERAARQQLARSAERNQILRELNQSVLRRVTVMITTAHALLDELAHQRPVAPDHIAAIESAGRSALCEMRDILGTLRAHDGMRQLGRSA